MITISLSVEQVEAIICSLEHDKIRINSCKTNGVLEADVCERLLARDEAILRILNIRVNQCRK